MPGVYSILFAQDFSNTDTIVVTHGLNRGRLVAQVIIDGQERGDLVISTNPTDGYSRNEFTVLLSSPQSGIINVFSSDTVPVEVMSPEDAATNLTTNNLGERLDGYQLPSPTCPGQVLFSVDVNKFVPAIPITSYNAGWLINQSGILLVNAENDES